MIRYTAMRRDKSKRFKLTCVKSQEKFKPPYRGPMALKIMASLLGNLI